MSWTKQTIRLSVVDDVIEQFKKELKQFKLTLMGKVAGQGMNDLSRDTEEWRVYLIRRLEFGDTIILEQMVQNGDMELDDFIMSYTYNRKDLPKTWKYKVKK